MDGATDVYNPFSLLNAFSDLRFGSYWFSTGTPTFLTRMMLDIQFDYKTLEEGIDVDSRSLEEGIDVDSRSLEEGIDVDSRSLEEYRLNSSEPVPLLYQTGYLTIKEYEKEFESYTIVLPELLAAVPGREAPAGSLALCPVTLKGIRWL